MLKYVNHKEIGYKDHDWLKTYHHFSFADYYDPNKMNYGPLRVVNDDIIAAHTGFPKHPHRDMEIISYVVEGGLSHGDSMGNEETVYRGQVQYMSAGTGVYHSEYNHGDEAVRLFQIWVMPDQKDHVPNYGDYRFEWADRINQWLHLVGKGAPINIHQDVNFYVTYIEEGKSLNLEIGDDRQAYVIAVEGDVRINELLLKEQDALEATESMIFKGIKNSHVLVIEMVRE
jgi:redox-sensitive bicupin YhaK (pirin superfamily)